jgi:hypothetical protein
MPLQLRHKVVTQNSDATENFQQLAATAPLTGNGSPETVIAAPVGTLYLRKDGGAATVLYVKESGTAAVGWVAK